MTAQHSFDNTSYANLRNIYVCEQALISSTVTWINKVKSVMPKEEVKAAWLRVNELHNISRQLHLVMCEHEKAANEKLKALAMIRDIRIERVVDALLNLDFSTVTEDEYEDLRIESEKVEDIKNKMRALIAEYSLVFVEQD